MEGWLESEKYLQSQLSCWTQIEESDQYLPLRFKEMGRYWGRML